MIHQYLKEDWNDLLKLIKEKTTKDVYENYIKSNSLLKIENNNLIIEVIDNIVISIFKNKVSKIDELIKNYINSKYNCNIGIKFIIKINN